MLAGVSRRMMRLLAPADADPDYLARRFRLEGPVIRYRERGRSVVAVVGTERGAALLEQGGAALRAPPLPFSKLIRNGYIRSMPEPEHALYRHALAPVLAAEVAEAHEHAVRGLWAEALAAAAEERERTAALLVDAAHEALALLAVGERDGPVLAALLRKLPAGRRPILLRRRHTQTLDEAVRVLSSSPEEAPTFWSRARRPENGLALDPSFARIFVYSLRLGARDVGGLLHWILEESARNPSWLERCDDPVVAAAVVDETLRLHRSEYLYRRAHRRVRAGEADVPRSAYLRLCVAESHRDPRCFPDPDAFDPARFLQPRRPDSFEPFGHAPSRCLGAGVALLLARLFAEEASRWTMRIAIARPPVHDGFHWQPGSTIDLSLRAAE